jgi:hypothetical protein
MKLVVSGANRPATTTGEFIRISLGNHAIIGGTNEDAGNRMETS